jgi:hypothetical protein
MAKETHGDCSLFHEQWVTEEIREEILKNVWLDIPSQSNKAREK